MTIPLTDPFTFTATLHSLPDLISEGGYRLLFSQMRMGPMTATPDKPVVRETPPGGSLAGTGNRLRRRTITAVVAVISVALIAVLIRTLRESETIASRN